MRSHPLYKSHKRLQGSSNQALQDSATRANLFVRNTPATPARAVTEHLQGTRKCGAAAPDGPNC
eukprot:5097429-Alexandrium_andersonii.AAC.1